MRSRLRCTSGSTSTPSTLTCSSPRSAMCSAGRFSVAFTRSPAKSRSIVAGSSRSRASAHSSAERLGGDALLGEIDRDAGRT